MGRWLKIKKHWRCHDCGHLVAVTWQWFPASMPGTSTLAYCESCVEAKLEEVSK